MTRMQDRGHPALRWVSGRGEGAQWGAALQSSASDRPECSAVYSVVWCGVVLFTNPVLSQSVCVCVCVGAQYCLAALRSVRFVSRGGREGGNKFLVFTSFSPLHFWQWQGRRLLNYSYFNS
jgi:hypothetical protein